MCSKYFLVCVHVLHLVSLQRKAVQEKVLQLSHLTKCTYEYDVYTARSFPRLHFKVVISINLQKFTE